MALSLSIFDFRDYKEFLRASFPTSGEGRGGRALLAQALHCQSAFVSQVLNGESHFSLEHVIAIGEFLRLSREESAFLLLLAQEARAGSEPLRKHFGDQIDAILKRRESIKNRIQVRAGLKQDQQARYYRSWIPAAVHIALSIPKQRTPEAIAERLRLPVRVIREALDFLLEAGLAVHSQGVYSIGTARIHLGPHSPLIAQHHANWRIQAIQALAQPSQTNLHYSSVYSLSYEDREKIRAILLGALEKSEPILKASPEEGLFCLAMDFFEL